MHCSPVLVPVVNRNPVIADFAPPLYPFFEKIIDKKVSQAALNIFEKLIDYCCCRLYTAYRLRLEFRLSEASRGVAEKTHRFMDGALLYDRTKEGRGGIKCKTYLNLPAQAQRKIDYITVDHTIIRFDEDINQLTLFGKNYKTEYVVMQDNPDSDCFVDIIEKETNGNEKKWTIDTTDKLQHVARFGPFRIGQPEDYFLGYPHT